MLGGEVGLREFRYLQGNCGLRFGWVLEVGCTAQSFWVDWPLLLEVGCKVHCMFRRLDASGLIEWAYLWGVHGTFVATLNVCWAEACV